jgi:hypothetical protein
VLPSGESLLDNNDLGSSPENAFLKVSESVKKRFSLGVSSFKFQNTASHSFFRNPQIHLFLF